MGIEQLYNDNLRKLPNEYGDVSEMDDTVTVRTAEACVASSIPDMSKYYALFGIEGESGLTQN